MPLVEGLRSFTSFIALASWLLFATTVFVVVVVVTVMLSPGFTLPYVLRASKLLLSAFAVSPLRIVVIGVTKYFGLVDMIGVMQ